MHGAHHRADQPFNMATEVWSSHGAMVKPNAIFLAASQKRSE